MDCRAEKCGFGKALRRRKSSDPTLTGSRCRQRIVVREVMYGGGVAIGIGIGIEMLYKNKTDTFKTAS
jgi:hypothetical protein